MRVGALLLLAAAAWSQPLLRNDPLNIRGPAIGNDGRLLFFASKIRPDGRPDDATNLFMWTRPVAPPTIRRMTMYSTTQPYGGVVHVAYPGSGEFVAYSTVLTNVNAADEVHIFNLSTNNDRTVAVDTEGCVVPACVDCFFSCLRSLHMASNGSKVLYEVSRDRPFHTVNPDGSDPRRLDVYQGMLAPSPQRVISDGGLVVFVSSAPFGPTLVAAPTDVHVMNLDGSDIRKVTNFGTNERLFARDAVIAKNGSLIAFVSNYTPQGPAENAQVWVIGADGSNMRQVSRGAAASSPSLSADGSLVTFIQDGEIKKIGTAVDILALQTPVPITNFTTSAPSSAVLSDDGAQVAFALGPAGGLAAAVYIAPTASVTETRFLSAVHTPRVLFDNGVVSATGYGSASPGSLFTVYGANLGFDELEQAGSLPLPTALDEVQLLVNDQPVPLHATTPWQINAQMPQSVLPGTPQFGVKYTDGSFTNSIFATVAGTAPSNFAVPVGSQQAAALHGASARLVTQADAAAGGDVIAIYVVGLGRTDPVVAPGAASPGSPPAVAMTQPRLQIGGRDAEILFAGLAPGFAGLYQVNARVPQGLSAGYHALTWIQPDGSTIAVSGIYVR